MRLIKENLFKILLLIIITLFLGVILIFVGTYLNQQQKLAEQKYIDAKITKIEEQGQKEKEYKAKRSNECYDITSREQKQWNNVQGGNYNEMTDKCVVRYTTNEYKGVDCEKVYKNIPSLELACELGIFTKDF